MRLFFAVELPSTLQTALGQLRSDAAWARDYRWVDPASMHITLAFLGEQPDAALETLSQIGQQAASSCQAGKLTIGSAGSFGAKRAPRVLWIGLEGDLAKLQNLQRKLAEGLQRHNFPVEDRPFSPHITLARRREHANSSMPPDWPPATRPQPLNAPLKELTLFQSQLSKAGARYTPLAQFRMMPT